MKWTAKSGVGPSELIDLYRHINEKCNNLSLNGLITIGQFGHDYSTGPNPDFLCLLDCHKNVCNEFNLKPENVQISMGMSDDFEYAVSLLKQKNLLIVVHHKLHVVVYLRSTSFRIKFSFFVIDTPLNEL